MQILGKDFVAQGIAIDVYEDGCTRPCSDIKVVSDTLLQYQYSGIGTGSDQQEIGQSLCQRTNEQWYVHTLQR